MPFEDDRYYNSRQVRERGPWGRTLYYQMVRRGELPAFKRGNRLLHLGADLNRFLTRLPRREPDPKLASQK